MDDLENPNIGPAQQETLRAVRERKQLEVELQRKWRWPSGADWVLMIGVPILIWIIAAVVDRL